jgi:hypothetical protein
MNTLSRRSKLVSFRVSPDEYRSLCEACSDRGLRSVSELARSALDDVLGGNNRLGNIGDQLQNLWMRVQFLTAEFERLSRHIESPRPVAPCSESKPNA